MEAKDNAKKKLKLKVSAIKEGTVIDHIPAKNLFKVINILGLDKIENQITFGTNLDSHKLGAKAIIKVKRRFFSKTWKLTRLRLSLLTPNSILLKITR